MKFDGILQINDQLKPNIWQNNAIKPEIREKLIAIAQDFFENLGLDVDLDDITFTGSLANYNWTKLSDVDLHIIADFNLIDENTDLVREYFSAKTSNWNKNHEIKIFGHEVELYVQGIHEDHHSTGVYSLKNDEWIAEPLRIQPEIDGPAILEKANSFIDMIERADDLFDEKEYEESYKFSLKLADKIKKYRQSGLEDKGEYSNENLVFKYLRNNEKMKLLYDVRNDSYDRMMSLSGDYDRKFKIYIEKDNNIEKSGFDALEEEKKFQELVRDRTERAKLRYLGKGIIKMGTHKFPRSAPPGAGGS